MKFDISETYGEKPFSVWLSYKLKDYLYKRHGLETYVEMTPAAANFQDSMTEASPNGSR